MSKTVQDAESFIYYLPLQIVASLLMALVALLLGLFLAWLIWGRCKKQVLELGTQKS